MKTFEDFFMEIQMEMVSLCFEYARERVDNIYIYCFYDEYMSFADFFYRINGKIFEKNQIIKEYPENDVSGERELEVLKTLSSDLERLSAVCLKYKKEMPIEIKIIYNGDIDEMEVSYSYDKSLSATDAKSPGEMGAEWLEALK